MRALWLISVACLAAPAMANDPGARSAFPGGEAEKLLIRTPRDVALHVPNLVGGISPHGGAMNAFSLRGIGTDDLLPTSAPALATRVDGILLPQGAGTNFGFFDLDQISVYRGPQGVEFGRNSLGGAVDVKWRPMGDKLSGFGEGGMGDHSLGLFRASMQVPLNTGISFAISGYSMNAKGKARNALTGERTNEDDMSGLRGAIYLKPVERLNWTLAYTHMVSKAEALPSFSCNPVDPANCGGRYVTTGMSGHRRLNGAPQYGLPIAGPKARNVMGSEVRTTILSSDVEWGGEDHRLNIITGVVSVDGRTALDRADGRALPDAANPDPIVRGFLNGGLTTIARDDIRQFTQEVRLSGTVGAFDYLAGFSLLDTDSTTDIADLQTLENGTALGVPTMLADRVLMVKDKATAGFAQLSAQPLPWLRALAGVRYTDETRHLNVREHGTGVNRGQGEISSKLWTPRFELQVKPVEYASLRLSAARGSRSGGWNGRSTDLAGIAAYGAETGWTYEAALAATFWENRIRLNLSGYMVDTQGSQVPLAGGTIVNGADFRNKGVELELGVSPTTGLLLYSQLGTQDASYRVGDLVAGQQAACQAQLANSLAPVACGAGIVAADGQIARPPRAPKLSLALGGRWDIPIPISGIILTPSAHALYRSSYETDYANLSFAGTAGPGSRTASHWLVQAGVAIETDDYFWRLSLECRNCLDETVSEASLYGLSYLNVRRSWTVAARRRF